jgi:hypothetical protein
MVQLSILSGKQAGSNWTAAHLPVRVGRSDRNDLRLQDEGVWDQHLQLELDRVAGFTLRVQPQALVTLNGQPVQQARLANGDLIQIGSLKLRFSLSETQQKGLRFREWLTWAGIAAVCLGQIGLIYWLLD